MAFMRNNSQETYLPIIEQLYHEITGVRLIFSNFEAPLRMAISEHFPHADVYGSFYCFTKVSTM